MYYIKFFIVSHWNWDLGTIKYTYTYWYWSPGLIFHIKLFELLIDGSTDPPINCYKKGSWMSCWECWRKRLDFFWRKKNLCNTYDFMQQRQAFVLQLLWGEHQFVALWLQTLRVTSEFWRQNWACCILPSQSHRLQFHQKILFSKQRFLICTEI